MQRSDNMRRLLLICALTLIQVRCTTEATITGATACKEPVVASASAGLTPTFTWTPDCTVGHLSVLDIHGQPLWMLTDSGSIIPPLNGIRSGVVYLTVPPEAALLGSFSDSLVEGESYYLLLRVRDDIGGPGRLIDTLTFVP